MASNRPKQSRWSRWRKKSEISPESISSQDQTVVSADAQREIETEKDNNETISVNAAQETKARPFSLAAQDFAAIAEQSKDPREIDLATSVILGRLITLGVKTNDIELILKAHDHTLNLETSPLRDKLFQRISKELFTLAGLQGSFALALNSVKVLNDIQNPKKLPEELLEAAAVFFDFWEEQDSEEALVEFFSLWGKVCVRVSRTDLFLAAAPSMLKISGPKLLLKAMYLTLDLSFELWWITQNILSLSLFSLFRKIGSFS